MPQLVYGIGVVLRMKKLFLKWKQQNTDKHENKAIVLKINQHFGRHNNKMK